MKRWILSCVLLLLFLGYVQAQPQAQTQTQPQTAQPKLVMEQETYDAGEIFKSEGGLKHDFVVKNEGTAELKILNAAPG